MADTALTAPDHDGQIRPSGLPRKTAILVVGMHRSGTSALTRVLNLAGCDGPKTFIEGDQFNERGYWESSDFAGLNEEILKAMGSSWDSWAPLGQTWDALPDKAEYEAQADRLLRSHFLTSNLFVLKDPRFCRILPFWQDALERFDADLRVVMPVRPPVEVAASLLRRNMLNPSVSQLIWLRNVLDAEHASRMSRRVFVSYEGLINDWPTVLQQISEELQVTWPQLNDDNKAKVNQFLSPSLQHHSMRTADSLSNVHPIGAPALFETYSILASRLIMEPDLTRLDKIRQGFDEAASLFLQPMMEIEAHSRKLKARLDSATTEHADLEAALAAELDGSRTLRTELAEAQARLAAELDGSRTLRTELAEAQARLAAELDGSRTLRTELAEAQATGDRLQEGLRTSEEQHQDAKKTSQTLQMLLSEIVLTQKSSLREIDLLWRQLNEQAKKNDLLQSQVKESEQLKQKMAAIIKTAQKETTALQNERKLSLKLTRELAAAREAFDAIHQSASWRATLPYRAARGWVSRKLQVR